MPFKSTYVDVHHDWESFAWLGNRWSANLLVRAIQTATGDILIIETNAGVWVWLLRIEVTTLGAL